MVGHREVAHTDAHPFAGARDQRIDAREDPAVPGPQVEVEHRRDPRRVTARLDVVGGQQKGVVAIDPVAPTILRMHDEQTHHPHRHLDLLVGMRVVHEGTAVAGRELVDEGLAGRDLRLRQATHAIHARGQQDAVPVDGGVLGQSVGHEDAHPLALDGLERGPRRLAVVAPQPRLHAGGEFAHHRLGHEMELAHAIDDTKGRAPAVEGDHRIVGRPGGGRGWRFGSCRGPRRDLGQAGQRGAADGGASHGGGDPGAAKKLSA